ncbi:hypothetical protein D3C77_775740 [compost metagenome]
MVLTAVMEQVLVVNLLYHLEIKGQILHQVMVEQMVRVINLVVDLQVGVTYHL